MDQTTRTRRSSKRKREREPESEDQNQACKVPVVEDPNKDVQSNSTTRSTSSSSQSGWDHDVFLSFRGKDTRKNFIDHLYTNLERVGIRTFRDDEGLRRGKTISTELVNAIRGSRISIVVFSKGYASSRWCLNELAEIVDCKNTIGHTLLPIFYHVDTSDVRNQEGTFKEAFLRHEKRFQTDMKRVHRWREALTEAANCSGWDLESVANGYESRFIKQIVGEVLCKVNPARLDVAKHPIGMESRVDNIKYLLNLGTSDVLIVGIYGMGGIGKTTLAKAVYNEICVAFEGSSFLSNLKESSEKPNGLVHLQEQLLNDILKTNLKISNVDRGISIIEKRIQGKKVLVILDDVDDFENLHALVEKQWFGPGSRVIVTTRDECLLNQLGVDERYKVKELNQWESLRLFSWHAFKMANPIEDCLELSIEAVDYAGGLPFALVVLGSYLKVTSIADWKSELEKLRRTPHNKIQKILEMSYDSLNNYTKEIFLDIACFFVGMDKEYAIKILDDFKFSSKTGIRILNERSLVTIGYRNELKMHNLIQDMGREIVCKESPKYPGKRSRLWFHKDVLNVLHKFTGSETVEGLILNLHLLKDVHLKTEAFTNMKNLRLLQINSVNLTGSYEHLSEELKWLCWQKCPLEYLPKNFHLENLVILDMQHSNVKRVWKTKKIFNKLKVLNLSNSIYLTKLPDFSQVPHLEILILEGCTNLKYLPNFLPNSHLENLNLEGCISLIEILESIGLLQKLVLLNLRGCKNLRNLSPNISKMKSLKTLVLSECFNLKKVPKQLGNMTALTKLYLEKTAIKQLPSSFSLLENLETLSLHGSECLIKSPEFSQTSRLKFLELEGCTSLVEIHESIGFLKGLDSLNLNGCQELKNLPSSMSNLEIEYLSLCGCSKLQKLPEEFGHKTALLKLKGLSLVECTALQSILLPVRVEKLYAEGCTSLETILILKHNCTVVVFKLKNCSKLVKIQRLKSLKHGFQVDMGRCISLADDFRNSIFQVLSGCRSKVHLPGSEIPNWIIRQTIGSSISFRVPPSFNVKTGKVLVCIVYAPTAAYMEGPRKTFMERPRKINLGESISWQFYMAGQCPWRAGGGVTGSLLFGCLCGTGVLLCGCLGGRHPCRAAGLSPDFDISEDHIHVQKDSIKHKFKSGDEIELSVDVFNKEWFEVKKCGIHFLVDEQNVRDEDESDFDTSTDDDEV